MPSPSYTTRSQETQAPTHVLRMLVQATEIGYIAALRDVRDGKFDAEIEEWRPDLDGPATFP